MTLSVTEMTITDAFGDVIRDALGLPAGVALRSMPIGDNQGLARFEERLPQRLRGASAKRRREFLAGRWCATQALAEAGCGEPAWLPQGADALPVWPEGWTGSISHSASMALAVAGRKTQVAALGVDLEEILPDTDLAGVAELVAQPGELAVLAELPASLALLLLFSAKESVYKALYPQMRTLLDFSAARAVALSGHSLRLRLGKGWGVHWPEGTELEVRHACGGNHVVTSICLT